MTKFKLSHSLLKWSFLTVITLLVSLGAWSQTSTGSLSGTVHDSSGAIVPGAQVTAKVVSTGRIIKQQTNGQGDYALFSLEPGTYEIETVKDGFQKSHIGGVQINVAQALKLDIALTVGSVSSEVVVTADQEMLTNDTPTVSSLVSQQELQSTPLQDRSAIVLAVYTAGVTGDPQYSNGSQSEIPGIYLNASAPGLSFTTGGSRPGLTSQLIDGFDVTLNAYPRTGLTLSSQTTEAITVQQYGLQAQYGRSGGGILNQATRGGGDKYHGQLSFRNVEPKWDAATFNSPFPAAKHQEEYGGTISGPVPSIHEIFGRHTGVKHNTFFLATFEPLRQADQAWSRGRLPTPEELGGKFNNSLDLLNTSILRASGYAAAVAAPRVGNLYYQYTLNAQGFPTGSQLPSSQYVQVANNDLSAQFANNTTAKTVASYFPTPTSKTPYAYFYSQDGSYASDGTNAYVVRGVTAQDNRFSVRVDQSIGDKDHMFVRYSSVPVVGTRYNFMGPNSPANAIAADNYYSKSFALVETHTFGNNMVNEFRASYLRSLRRRQPAPATLTKDFGAAMGLLPAFNGKGFPSIGGLPQGVGSGGSQGDGGRSLDVNMGYGDDFSILKGNHNIKIGGEFLALQLDRYDISYLSGGAYSFSGADTNSGSSGGSGFASFDLGLVHSFTTATPQPYYYRWKYYAAYVQDTWKVTPKITLDLGLRYSLEMPRKEKFGLQGSFDPNVTGSLNGVAATGGLVLTGENGRSALIFPANYKNFEPRLGMSYSLNPATTIHVAYSLMHAPLTGVGDGVVPNLSPAAQSVGPTTGGVNAGAIDYITNPVKPIPALPALTTGPIFGFSAASALPFVNQSNAVPYVQTWSVMIDRQIGKFSLQASYVGNKGTHLYSDQEGINVPPLAALYAGIQNHIQFGSTNLASNGVANKYGLGNETYLQSLVPYQQVYNNTVTEFYPRHTNSLYQGLLFGASRSMAQGFSLFGSFAWTKSLDTSSIETSDFENIYGEALPQSPYTKETRSYSGFDTPLRTSGGYTIELPIGKGKLLNVENGIANFFLGGWTTTGLISAQDGFPFYAFAGGPGYFVSTLPVCSGAVNPTCTATKQYGSGGAALLQGSLVGAGTGQLAAIRANIVPGVPLKNPNWRHDPTGVTSAGGYVNAAAFTVPGGIDNPQFSTAPRTMGNLRNPTVVYFDETVRKDVPLHSERVKLQLQLDVLNLMNHPNFLWNPGTGTHNLTNGSLNATTGLYGANASFGVMGPSNVTSGRQLGIGAVLNF